MALAFTPGSEVALRARLGEMTECWLEVRCGPCGSATVIPIRLLARQHGAARRSAALSAACVAS